MYNNLSTNCFNVAIAIARQREQSALLLTLLDFLEEHLPLHQSALYDVIGKGPIKIRQHENEVDVIDDEWLVQCYRAQKGISAPLPDGEHRYIFPIHGIGHIKHLVDIRGRVLDELEHQSLIQLITLFNSQFLLLDKNDHDALTGLLNRRAFEERLTQLLMSHQHRDHDDEHSYCFALLDIDRFKRVNDDYGHLYGDEVLILFAGMMEKVFRHEDMLFRYGGEEFAVVLNNVNIATAASILDRFRDKVAKYDFPQVGQVTVSIGFTAITRLPNTTDLIAHADKALYYSKDNGRNQVNAYEILLAQGKIAMTAQDSNDIELF
ncbi:GGDEF domain-containing protein [Sulfuriflexus mobilis]|uniref:GGDEF domain-containing protein n=1 Tax=Sulfuriflexus mobilis TaxID=1811807 RepID=UPI000F823F9D|nr:GGDEF domain-containing protein [Sulfuriflexus mobilis]